jgi:hypothetical protein
MDKQSTAQNTKLVFKDWTVNVTTIEGTRIILCSVAKCDFIYVGLGANKSLFAKTKTIDGQLYGLVPIDVKNKSVIEENEFLREQLMLEKRGIRHAAGRWFCPNCAELHRNEISALRSPF